MNTMRDVRRREPANQRQPESTMVQGHTVALSTPQEYVLTHNGMELPNLYTLEQCGLHNNATIELHTSDVWDSMCAAKLDEGMDSILNQGLDVLHTHRRNAEGELHLPREALLQERHPHLLPPSAPIRMSAWAFGAFLAFRALNPRP